MLALLLLAAAPPVFHVRALGVLGGDDDSNLSSYVVGTAERPQQLMIDAGAFTRGLPGETQPQRTASLAALFKSLDAVLITHSHLDHVGGLIVTSPVLFGINRTLPVYSLPETTKALHDHAFAAPLWIDLKLIALKELPPEKPVTLGDFTVESIPLVHPVPSAAYLIGRGDSYYLHLGDTGPTDAVWKRAAPLAKKHQLRAVAVEVSFPNKDEALAKASGHLTPKLLAGELAKLGADVKVMAIHIKAAQYDAVVEELKASKLPVLIPQQGAEYDF